MLIRNDRYYVYILVSKKRRVMYVGMTSNMQKRLCQHRNNEIEGFSKKYRVHQLVYFEEYAHPQEAIAREKVIKGWTREKKNLLVKEKNPNFEDLSHSFI